MKYLNIVLDRLKIKNNSISFGYYNAFSKMKKKVELNFSNKNIKLNVIIYIIIVIIALLAFFVVEAGFLFNTAFNSFNNFNFNNTIESNDISNIFKNIFSPLLLSIVINIMLIGINFIYIFYKIKIKSIKKDSKPININMYNRDLPEAITPAHARLLVYDGKVDEMTLASTIMDLIDRGYLKIETIMNKEDIFTKDIFILRTNKNQDELFEYEKYLINWFFDSERKSSVDIHKLLINDNTNPCEKFSIFQGLLLLSFPFDRYYRKKYNMNKLEIISVILIFVSFFIFSISMFVNSYLCFLWEFIFLFGFSNIIFKDSVYSINQKGAEVRDKFLDLKRFLIEFSKINEKTSEMISLWDFYLSYSIALGIEGIANEEISNFFGNNIYNLNNINNYDKLGYQDLINNISNVIKTSQQIYLKKLK